MVQPWSKLPFVFEVGALYDANRNEVAVLTEDDGEPVKPVEQEIQDGEYIARACNLFPRLVAVLAFVSENLGIEKFVADSDGCTCPGCAGLRDVVAVLQEAEAALPT